MEITNEKFYEMFNSRIFGDTIDTINTITNMKKLGLLKLSMFQEFKMKEYFDIAIRTK